MAERAASVANDRAPPTCKWRRHGENNNKSAVVTCANQPAERIDSWTSCLSFEALTRRTTKY